jgi:hypothetical protein
MARAGEFILSAAKEPRLGRFVQADTMIPNPSNPQAWDRYAYVYNNPLSYSDISGHNPNWFDFLMGFSYQFLNDLTIGTVDLIAASTDVCMDCNQSDAYEQGQQVGRATSTVVASTESVLGTAAAAEGLAAMGPTAGGGLACGAATGGGCLAIAGVSLTVEGAMFVGGTLEAAHGVGTMAYMQQHHIATNKNSTWTPKLQELFNKGGLSLQDEINKVGLEGHLGRHPDVYHQWVYDRLLAAIKGLDNQADIAAALKAELEMIADELLVDPGLLKGPR